MGKQRRKLQTNPTDYDYMDRMPLEGWIWEIIRRSENYKSGYKRIEENLVKGVYGDKEQFYKIHLGDIQKFLRKFGLAYCYTSITNPDYFLIIEKDKGVYGSIPKPQSKYTDNVLAVYLKNSMLKPFMIVSSIDVEQMERLNLYKNYIDTLTVSTPKDTIYLGISKKAKIKDIEELLIPNLKKFLVPKKSRVRDERWKYYLIVYDLKEKYRSITYKQIADLLSEAYPYIETTKLKNGKKIKKRVEGSDYFTEKNCENFYKNALSLIESGYKKYLYL